ncbi:DUF695 domain-containing protein [Rhodoferax sp.]|uniref:DUF695 domain-containing protein n=1 Tax=Rhodoferax sp. TaxID=50421 RepID=UPI0025F2549C|nr:DUF695 domain-containing protein [Rhodoferax sp.]
MSPTPEISTFWREFAAAEAALYALPLGEQVERANALLAEHIDGLALEVMGAEGDAVLDLIATAHGSVELFPQLTQLAAAAPALAHFRVSAFRTRSDEPDFPMGMDGFELASSEVLVALQPDNGQIALELRFTREMAPEFVEHAQQMSFIMLDHVLGEYDFAVKVGAVDFVDGDDEEQTWTPLHRLPAVFDAYWADEMGHTGLFPAGSHAWTALDLEFDCAVDDEGNDVDEDDLPDGEDANAGEGTVTVNTSANAVAMRADLVWALTLAADVPDEAAGAALHDLQVQAATLLQGPQLGIGAWTLVGEGRYQALFYVTDEALARGALAPLLARAGLPAVEVKVSFDPAWAGYFEYASYLA